MVDGPTSYRGDRVRRKCRIASFDAPDVRSSVRRRLGAAVLVSLLGAHASPGADEGVTPTEVHTVTAVPVSEDQPVGANRQPDWTTQHRFSEVEIYVLAPWEVSAELGWDASAPRDGDSDLTQAIRQEFEIGLPWRTQLDYVLHEFASEEQGFIVVGHALEASVALADWGVIPLNPTLLAEWIFGVHEQPDEVDVELLLGDDLGPRWRYGINVGFELEVGGERARGFAISQAVSHSVVPGSLGIGVEMKLLAEHGERAEERGDAMAEAGDAGDDSILVTAGPSIQWRVTDDVHVNLATLFGFTGPSPLVDTYAALAFTWDGGEARAEPPADDRGLEPVSRHP